MQHIYHLLCLHDCSQKAITLKSLLLAVTAVVHGISKAHTPTQHPPLVPPKRNYLTLKIKKKNRILQKEANVRKSILQHLISTGLYQVHFPNDGRGSAWQCLSANKWGKHHWIPSIY